MTNANTRPEQIVDKNGKTTTVHKSNGKTANTKNIERVSPVPPVASNGKFIDVSNLSDGAVKHTLDDNIFGSVSIEREEDGNYVATSGFLIHDDAFDELREYAGNLSGYLADNENEIKDFITITYAADSVEVDASIESIKVEYKINAKVDSDGKVNAEDLLDDLYETRAATLHPHAYDSQNLSYGIIDFTSATDTAYVEPINRGYGFSEE